MTAAQQAISSLAPAHGRPNWIDLHTHNVSEASEFYANLFHWEFRSRYSLVAADQLQFVERASASLVASCDGYLAAELVEHEQLFADMCLPSTWRSHVFVDQLRDTLEVVERAGGSVLAGPQVRGATALTATIVDPHDAMINLWQPVEAEGLQTSNHGGTLAWLELETPNPGISAAFYGEVFGWETAVALAESGYGTDVVIFQKDGVQVGTAIYTPLEEMPASWCPVFAVHDVDLLTVAAFRLGATVLVEPWQTPVGRQACLVDPTGAAFSMIGPQRLGPLEL